MNFNLQVTIDILKKSPSVYMTLLESIPNEWLIANEGANTWSPFDVLGHLIHGEKTDWMIRAEIILSDREDKTFAPFDRFAQFEDSKGKTIRDLLTEFSLFRKENITRLSNWNLTEQQLDKKGVHPDLGEVSLRQLLATWVIHDFAHLNQITRVLSKNYAENIGSWSKYIGLVNHTNSAR